MSAGVGEAVIQRHSKSFAFASKLLPPEGRAHAVAVYAWCRRADDAIDLAEPSVQPAALDALERELAAVYAGRPQDDPVLDIFQRSVEARGIPERYARDLLTGMRMDVDGTRYGSVEDLLRYCYHVAGCVGLMMCHVMGLRDDTALPRAAHLGMAMQLTNICRDVAEDWERGRLYLPSELLERHGAGGLLGALGRPLPEASRPAVAAATADLLDEADRYYRSGDGGVPALSLRCALAIRTARRVYSAIGDRVRRQGCDPLAGRAYVSGSHKVLLAVLAIAETKVGAVRRLAGGVRGPYLPPTQVVSFPGDILPLG